MPEYHYEVSGNSKTRKFYGHLREVNGEIVIDQAQGYTRKNDAQKQFRKIFAIDDLQALHNLLEEGLVNGDMNIVREGVSVLEAIQARIVFK